MKKLLFFILIFFPVLTSAYSFEVFSRGGSRYPSVTDMTANYQNDTLTISAQISDISGVLGAWAVITNSSGTIVKTVLMEIIDTDNDIYFVQLIGEQWAPGTYTIYFQAQDGLLNKHPIPGVTASPPLRFTVYPPLSVSASVSPNPALVNQTVIFIATPSGGEGNYTYQWSGVCEGLSAYERCATSFSSPGDYTATVTVTSGDQTATASATVTVYAPLSVQIAGPQPSPAFVNETVTIIASASGGSGSYAYQWSEVVCSNGNASRDCITSFPSAGSYRATVQVVSSDGQTDSEFVNFGIYTLPSVTASAAGSTTPAVTDSPVYFSAVGSGGGGSGGGRVYRWSGACSKVCNTPTTSCYCTANFSEPGIYTATVEMTDLGKTVSATAEITVYRRLDAVFTALPNLVFVGEPVTFTAEPSGGNGSYIYDWSKINPNCSSGSSTCAQSFLMPGSYDMSVEISSGGQTRTFSVNVKTYNHLAVAGSSSPNPVGINEQATFTALPSGGVGNYFYNWSEVACSNGNTSQDCLTSFSTEGVYTAIVTVTSGAETATYNIPITVIIPPLGLSMSVFPSPALTTDLVTFYAVPSGGTGTYSYQWSGACIGSSSNMCTTVFPSAGDYTATATVTSGSQTISGDIDVTVNWPPLNVLIIPPSATIFVNDYITLTANAFGGTGGYSYSWAGCNGTESSCSASFPRPGRYSITVVVIDSAGNVRSATASILVNVRR